MGGSSAIAVTCRGQLRNDVVPDDFIDPRR
jgi:hypothetical protein